MLPQPLPSPETSREQVEPEMVVEQNPLEDQDLVEMQLKFNELQKAQSELLTQLSENFRLLVWGPTDTLEICTRSSAEK